MLRNMTCRTQLVPSSYVPVKMLVAKQLFMLIFADDDTEAMILVDASNAFNCLNKQVMLCNCSHILINTYRYNSRSL